MILFDRNSSKEAKEVYNFLNEKMIHDVSYIVFSYKSEYGINLHDIRIYVDYLHMGYGLTTKEFNVTNLVTWNKNIFLAIIEDEFVHEIKGNLAKEA